MERETHSGSQYPDTLVGRCSARNRMYRLIRTIRFLLRELRPHRLGVVQPGAQATGHDGPRCLNPEPRGPTHWVWYTQEPHPLGVVQPGAPPTGRGAPRSLNPEPRGPTHQAWSHWNSIKKFPMQRFRRTVLGHRTRRGNWWRV